MRKYLLLFGMAIATVGTLSSCVDRTTTVAPPQQDNDTYPIMGDVSGSFNAANQYTISVGITNAATNVVLVYRRYNTGSSGAPVWQILPDTVNLTNNRSIKYSFLFDTKNVEIYADTNFDPATMTSAEANSYMNNQTFRIVLIPASQGKNANLDYSDYNSVIKFYHIDESKVKSF
ncbi:hypothetical protein [Chryseobacterium koreense]|uniref:Lipoprotein n=1 Tax=Chryseobacterium koreense CCUG 49689 TaxID=1304281 RepID=A0A0J7IYE0_9FLAO|nr:hypothetical protein [Chryseobacterium koreense]KMQ71268.1 hypothetical protein ACM44_07610 [Chryseobacterium koreense CCUG 49689]MBB5333857.1 hypothetical protein [Chryseobacterium koreense]